MFAQRVEVDFGKALLRQSHVVRGCTQVGQGVGRIACHAQRVGIDKRGQLLRCVGGDPAGTGVLAAFQADVGVVLAFESVLHHFKLQLANGTQQHVATGLGAKDLDRAFFAQLGQALLQLLGAQRVFQHHRHEHLRRKEGQAGELQSHAAVGDGVAQLHAAVGGKADDVTGISLFHRLAPLAHEGDHAGWA